MQWRIWKSSDNYAENGTADAERLYDNYSTLAEILNTEFDAEISLSPHPVGITAIPFADILQAIEDNMEALHIFTGISAWATARVWLPASRITYADINRWENNGKLVEENIGRGRINFQKCGQFVCGRR